MISQTYPSTRPLPPVTTTKSYPALPPYRQQSPVMAALAAGESRPNEADRKRAAQFQISPDEFVRRDNIVRQLFLNCPFSVNQKVKPLTEQGYAEYGELTLRSIFKSYHDFPTLEAKQWPKDDLPFIITASPEKGDNDLLLITTEYLRKEK